MASSADSAGPHGALRLPAVEGLRQRLGQAHAALEDGSFGGYSDESLRRQVGAFQGDVDSLAAAVGRQLEYARVLRTRDDVKQLLREGALTRQRKVRRRRTVAGDALPPHSTHTHHAGVAVFEGVH